MPLQPRYIFRNASTCNLDHLSSVSLFTLGVPPPAPSPPVTTYLTLPPARVLLPPFHELSGTTLTPPDHGNALSFTPDSVVLSVDRATFVSLGLQSERKLRPTKLEREATCVPIQVGRGKRAKWALAEERVGTVRVAVGGDVELEGEEERRFEVRKEKMKMRMGTGGVDEQDIPSIDALFERDECAQEAIDQLQRLVCMPVGKGTLEWTVQRYDGYCDGSFGKETVGVLSEWSKRDDVQFCGALMRAATFSCRPWRHGNVRVTGAAAFGADAAQLIVFRKGTCIAVDMRADVL